MMNHACAGCRWHRLEFDGRQSESFCNGPNDDVCEAGDDGKMSHYEEADPYEDGHEAMEQRAAE